MVTYDVTFEPDGKTVKVEKGLTITEAAAVAEISIDSPCGGEGRCGKCKVMVDARNIEPPDEQEKKTLSEEDLGAGYRLAC